MCIRILLMVPIFATTTYITASGCLSSFYSKILLQPIQEIYESFIIYTFFTYLIYILGGERKILMELGWKKDTTIIKHPFLGRVLPSINVSDPRDFLFIKRGVLQYVWLKPIFIIGNLIVDLNEDETSEEGAAWTANLKFILLVGYNISASISLYELAMFWKCLYKELAKFKPWPKFLCVKLIIFASYWQSILMLILQYFGVFESHVNLKDQDMAYIYQNVLLCLEMVPFAIGHLIAFSNEPYTYKKLPESSRLSLKYALRDFLGIQDLIIDSYNTLFGTEYNYRNFDAARATLTSKADQRTRNARITEGLRFSRKGKEQYWLDSRQTRIISNNSNAGNSQNFSYQQPMYSSYGSTFIATSDNSPIKNSDSTIQNSLQYTSQYINPETQNKKQLTITDQLLNKMDAEEPWSDFLEGFDKEYIPYDETYNESVIYDIEGYKYSIEKAQEKMKLLKYNTGPKLSSDYSRIASIVDDIDVVDESLLT
ncbi:hypothetical protein QEN19_000615 [Hanseniaspora menglaensis]